MSSKKVPNLLKSKIVPSSVQLYGETFHREANLDAWFKELTDRIAELEKELHNMGALHFRTDLTHEERQERCREISLRAVPLKQGEK